MDDKIKIGSLDANSWKVGSSFIDNMYSGDIKIFERKTNYLCCFTAEEDTDITLNKYGTFTIEPVVYYSIDDKKTWNQLIYGTAVSLSSGSKMYLRGNNTRISASTSIYSYFSSTGKFKASGSIMSLLDESGLSTEISTDYVFVNLFKNCSTLIEAPVLPATTLAGSCYQYMFSDCTSLTQAPELPATTLASYCYTGMFKGCTSLTTAPELPATTLASYCYISMFFNCTSLTQAPALPATTLASYCYYSMFYKCTSLTQAPELPATTLASYCYYSMFYNCTSLTQAPELPATTLAEDCYFIMFEGCESLTKAPALPATTLRNSCYTSMFSGCTSLTQAPALPATTLAGSCYQYMFSGCTSLTQAPVLPATTLTTDCYDAMFSGCTSLQVSYTQTAEAQYEWKIPSSGTFTNITTYNQSNMFTNCLGTRSSDTMSGATGESHTYYTQNQPI